MRRYLPDKVWDRLTPEQRRATNAKKIRGDRSGRQFVANTEVAARRSRVVRMRSKALGKPIGGMSEFDGDGDGFLTGPSGQDNIPAPAAPVARTVTDAAKPRLGGEGSRPRGGKLPPPKAGTRVRGSKTWGGVFALRRMNRDKQIAVMKYIMETRLMLKGKRPPSRRQTNEELAEKFGFINTDKGLESLQWSARNALDIAKRGMWSDNKITESYLQVLLGREQARPRPNFNDDFPWSASIRAAYQALGKKIPKTLDDWEPPARKPDADADALAAERSRAFLRSIETRLNIPDEQPARNRRLRQLRNSLSGLGGTIPQSLRDEIANLDKPSDEDRPAFMDHKEIKPPEIIKNDFDGVNMMIAQPIEGLRGPNHGGGRKDFSEIRAMAPERRKAVSDAYMGGPVMDDEAAKYWDAAAEEIEQQFQFLTEQLGLKVEFTDDDPYPDFLTMREEVLKTGVLKILKTESTGGHPYWSNELNDKFRAVHDTFGHLATGRGFDRHGEEAAYQAHLPMFGPDAQRAIVVELRAQNSALIETGDFQEQKVMLFPEEFIKMLKILGLLSKILKVSGDVDAARESSDADNAFDKTNVHHASCGRRMKK
jgi:hypothetical protein